MTQHKALVAGGTLLGIGIAGYVAVKRVVREAEKLTLELQQQFVDQQR